jgi:hypothetical protein
VPAASAGAVTSQTLVVWGDYASMQQGVPTGLSDVTAIAAAGDHGLLLKADGTVTAWGAWREGQIDVPAGLDRVVAVSAGREWSLALKDDGTVVAWGDNSSGQTDVPAGLTDVVAISAGARHNLAVRGDGTVVGWGENAHGESQPPAGLDGVTAVAAGAGHSLALRADGTVVGWGLNGAGQASVPAGLDQVVAVAAGGASGGPDYTSNGYSMALRSDGTVVAWGANNRGQTDVPAGLAGVTALDTDWGYALALRADGTVVAWGDVGHTSVPEGLDHVTAVAAGGSDGIALVSGAGAPLTAIACKALTSCSSGWDGTRATGWYGGLPVDVGLRAFATAGSAVVRTVYTLDGSDPTTSPTAVTYVHSPDTFPPGSAWVQLPDLRSTTTVRFFSVDAAGHTEPTRSQLIKVDLTSPTTTISCNAQACSSGSYPAPVTVSLSATDAGGSGVAATLYTTDGTDPRFSATAVTYTVPFTVTRTTTVKYASKDVAGNTEPPLYGDPVPVKSQLIQVSVPPTTGSVVLTPTDDSYTAKGDPATAYGAADALKVNSGARERRTFLKSDLAAIPSGATGVRATLRLYAGSGASSSVRFPISQVATDWRETTLTWNNQPAPGTVVATRAGLVGGTYNDVDMSSMITGNGVYAMAVTDGSTAVRWFASKESSLKRPPQLVVSWTNPG